MTFQLQVYIRNIRQHCRTFILIICLTLRKLWKIDKKGKGIKNEHRKLYSSNFAII